MTREGNQIPGKTPRLRDLGCPRRGWPPGGLALSQDPPPKPSPGCSHVSWNRRNTALGPSSGPGSPPAGQGSGSPAADRPAGLRRGLQEAAARQAPPRPSPARRLGAEPARGSRRPLRSDRDRSHGPQISAAKPTQKAGVAVCACALAPAPPRHAVPLVSMATVACAWSLVLGLGSRVEAECSAVHRARCLHFL